MVLTHTGNYSGPCSDPKHSSNSTSAGNPYICYATFTIITVVIPILVVVADVEVAVEEEVVVAALAVLRPLLLSLKSCG